MCHNCISRHFNASVIGGTLNKYFTFNCCEYASSRGNSVLAQQRCERTTNCGKLVSHLFAVPLSLSLSISATLYALFSVPRSEPNHHVHERRERQGQRGRLIDLCQPILAKATSEYLTTRPGRSVVMSIDPRATMSNIDPSGRASARSPGKQRQKKKEKITDLTEDKSRRRAEDIGHEKNSDCDCSERNPQLQIHRADNGPKRKQHVVRLRPTAGWDKRGDTRMGVRRKQTRVPARRATATIRTKLARKKLTRQTLIDKRQGKKRLPLQRISNNRLYTHPLLGQIILSRTTDHRTGVYGIEPRPRPTSLAPLRRHISYVVQEKGSRAFGVTRSQ